MGCRELSIILTPGLRRWLGGHFTRIVPAEYIAHSSPTKNMVPLAIHFVRKPSSDSLTFTIIHLCKRRAPFSRTDIRLQTRPATTTIAKSRPFLTISSNKDQRSTLPLRPSFQQQQQQQQQRRTMASATSFFDFTPKDSPSPFPFPFPPPLYLPRLTPPPAQKRAPNTPFRNTRAK